MALKLFRTTGYESLLMPGETRRAWHPGWLILLVSIWIGFACNVAIWRELRFPGATGAGLGQALLAGAFITGTCASLLSLFGWRRTLKPAATLLVVLAALAASRIWVQDVPVDRTLLDRSVASLLLPTWPLLLRWQVPAIVIVLGLMPSLWIWQLQVRRLSGPHQLGINAIGMLAGLAVLVPTGWLLVSSP